jgi:glycosyltransferase involved in cell wall biosynthesis
MVAAALWRNARNRKGGKGFMAGYDTHGNNGHQQTVDICAVICTHNRTDVLRRALDSLKMQAVCPAELLVVDNAPADDSTRTLVREQFPSVRYVQEAVPGLNFARNRALRETARKIVAYMDDDAVADPHWAAATAAVFAEDSRIAICTGRVEPLCLETEGQRLFEAQGGLGRGETRIRMPRDARYRRMHGLRAPLIAWSLAIGVGCSLAVRRETISALGGFDEALDMGVVLPGGGDVDIIWRTLDDGKDVVYEPLVRVMHEHRRDLETVQQQILGHRQAEIAFLVKSARAAEGGKRAVIWTYLLWRLMKPGLRLARRLVFGSDPLPATLLWRLWRTSWRGLGSYSNATRLARQRAARVVGEQADHS